MTLNDIGPFGFLLGLIVVCAVFALYGLIEKGKE